jgi:ankyrin repeat protein
MELEQYCEIFGQPEVELGWQEHREERVKLLNTIDQRLLYFCLPWICRIKPEFFTQNYIMSFNRLANYLDWLSIELTSCQEPQIIAKIIDIFTHIDNLTIEVLQFQGPHSIGVRELLNTVHLFTDKCPVSKSSFINPDFSKWLEISDLAHIWFSYPRGVKSNEPDALFLEVSDITTVTQKLTENDIHLGLANHLFNLKKMLTSDELNQYDTDYLKNLSLQEILETSSELVAFKQQLNAFKPRHLSAKKNKLLTYKNLSLGCQFASVMNDLLIVSYYIRLNESALGLNAPFPDDFAIFCKNWLEKHKNYQLVSTPNAIKKKQGHRLPEYYRLTEKEINHGLIWIGREYEERKANAENLPRLHFLPLISKDDLPNAILNLPSDGPRSFVGICDIVRDYITYFIHRWSSGSATVIVLDSIPSSHYQQAKSLFKKTLPGCEYISLDQVKQFNNSDSGIYALQNVEDIINSLSLLESNSQGRISFLKFRNNQIIIDTQALTIKVEDRNIIKIVVATRNTWENRFCQKKQCSRLEASFDSYESFKTVFSDLSYSYKAEKLNFEKYAKEILEDYLHSSAFKAMLKRIKQSPTDLTLYGELATDQYEKFIKHRTRYKSYIKKRLEEQLPDMLVRYIFKEVHINAIKKIFFEKLITKFFDQYKNNLFPRDLYLDSDGCFQNLDVIVTQYYQEFLEKNTSYKEFIEQAKLDSVEKLIIQHVQNYAKQIRKKEFNLLFFKGKPLTYALLQQCVDIWEAKYKFTKSGFLKKLKKIIINRTDHPGLNRQVTLGEEISDEVLTALLVVIRYFMPKSRGTLLRIINALRATKPFEAKEQEEEKMQAPQDSEILTLEQLHEEITRIGLQEQLMLKALVALDIIKDLIYIRDELNKQGDNLIEEAYNKKSLSLVTPHRNVIYFVAYSTWESAKICLNELAMSIPHAYLIAKRFKKEKQFISKFGIGCIAGSTRPVLDWAARLGSIRNSEEVLSQAYQEAESYLSSVGRSLSFENIFKFIVKYYDGTPCIHSQARGMPERAVRLKKKMITEYLDIRGEQKIKLKDRLKESLVYTYNHYSLPKFKALLAKKPLNSPGLNKLFEGDSLLIDACHNGKTEHVRALIAKGVDIDLVNNNEESAWEAACNSIAINEISNILKILFDYLPRYERVAKARYLLEKTYFLALSQPFELTLSYINDLDFLSQPRETLGGTKFIEHACKHNKQTFLDLLLKKKNTEGKSLINANSAFAFVEETSRKNYGTHKTSMLLARFALACGNGKFLKKLMEVIDNEQKQVGLARTLIPYFVTEEANYGAFDTLLPFIKDTELLNECYPSETLLTQACQLEREDVVDKLLEANVNPCKANIRNQTPLMIACEKGNEKIVVKIIESHFKRSVNVEQAMLQPKSILVLALAKSLSMFFKVINFLDEEGKRDFYQNNLNYLVEYYPYFSGEQISKWQEAGLFSYLENPLQLEPILLLLKMAIEHKQNEFAKRLLSVLSNRSMDTICENSPSLLLLAYNNDNFSVFSDLLKFVKNFEIPGLNLPLENEHTFLTYAIFLDQTHYIEILLALKGLNIEVVGMNKTPLQWLVEKENLSLTKNILNELSSRSLENMRQSVRRDDVLYLAYAQNNGPIFKYILETIQDLSLPGLTTNHELLYGGTFITDNKTRYNCAYSQILVEKGIPLPREQIGLFETIYSRVRYGIAKLPKGNRKDECEKKLKEIEETCDIDLKQSLADSYNNQSPLKEWKSFAAVLKNRMQKAFGDDKKMVTGHSPFHEFYRSGGEKTFPQLYNDSVVLAAGAYPDSITGKTALHYALAKKNNELRGLLSEIQILVAAHSRYRDCFDIQDFDGRVLLHYACMNGNTEVIDYMLAENIGLHGYPDKTGKTPLHYACLNGNEKTVSKLLSVDGVKEFINSLDRTRSSALHYACEKNNALMIKHLIANGAHTLLQVDEQNNTPLHLAIMNNISLDGTKELMKGPSFFDALFIKNQQNLTPFEIVKRFKVNRDMMILGYYLLPFYKLARHAKSLDARKDINSKAKAKAISQLLNQVAVADDDDQKNLILKGLNSNSEPNIKTLFKPRTTYGFFKASEPMKTKTAKEVNSLKWLFKDPDSSSSSIVVDFDWRL